MKKSQFITIFIMFIAASVLICIGCFMKTSVSDTPGGPKETSHINVVPTIRPLETETPANATGGNEPTGTGDVEATPEPTEQAPSEEPAGTEMPAISFPTVSNADFDKYSNSFEHFSTRWVTGANNQNRAEIQDYVLPVIKDVDYVFYTITSETAWDHYMTFSMHYEYGYTAKLLDLLKRHNIKAVFFVSELYIKENSELVKRMKDEGHVIGNRGVIGDEAIGKLTPETFAEGLMTVEREYQKLFGAQERMYLFRTDYFSNRLLKVAEAMGYTVVFRTYTYYSDMEDFKNRPAKDLAERFNERAAYNGSVSEFTAEKACVDALEIFIPTCIDENVSFKLIQRRR
ncbi:MAG: polysaccharide deacetylase family protein [Clostridia bacterium]|nr:polysaccharide deacetylase family protein [Clostridia bacterium]